MVRWVSCCMHLLQCRGACLCGVDDVGDAQVAQHMVGVGADSTAHKQARQDLSSKRTNRQFLPATSGDTTNGELADCQVAATDDWGTCCKLLPWQEPALKLLLPTHAAAAACGPAAPVTHWKQKQYGIHTCCCDSASRSRDSRQQLLVSQASMLASSASAHNRQAR